MTPQVRPIWVTGAGGLIGSWLVRTAPQDLQARGLTRRDLDLLNFPALNALFRSEQPAAVIHCAAMSRSPECEANPQRAHAANVDMTAHLAGLAAEIPFIFFSTDLVFDGRSGNYCETDSVNPLGVYAHTKAAAEQIVLQNPLHTVIRTSLNSGPSPTGDRGFDEQMRLAWRQGKTLRLFSDEFRCPIAAEATARALWELLHHRSAGIYHVAGSQRLSRFEMGNALAPYCQDLHPRFVPTSIVEYQGAPRPPDTTLNCVKAQRLLSFPLPKWTDWLNARSGTPAG